MYNTVADVQEKNDAVTYAEKKNAVSCKCTKQLWMYIQRILKNNLQKGVVKIKYVPTKEQVVDVLTKPLAHVKFEYFQDKLGPKGPLSKEGVTADVGCSGEQVSLGEGTSGQACLARKGQ